MAVTESDSSLDQLDVYLCGLQSYERVWRQMQQFTDQRNAESTDQLWLVEHPSVFTQGQAGKPEHLLDLGDIPVVQTDRGGQVTYHGPGQLVAYPLLNIRRLGIGVRELVTLIENSVVEFLASFNISGYPKSDAPGVYVDERKIASLGLRVRRGCSFHGVAINIDVDLAPFKRINPCGYEGLEMVRLTDLAPESLRVGDIALKYAELLAQKLGLAPVYKPALPAWCTRENENERKSSGQKNTSN